MTYYKRGGFFYRHINTVEEGRRFAQVGGRLVTPDLRLGDFMDTLSSEEWDTLIVDAPYGARTHTGAQVDVGTSGSGDGRERRPISYDAWSPVHVQQAVHFLAPRTSGWFCTITSHDLIDAWSDCLAAEKRYVFAPIPIVIPGMGVRVMGDGPSSEAVYMVVARPRSQEFSRWGTLPGYYLVAPGDPRRRSPRIGGKPLGLMERIVTDYSRKGGIVCDPCAGAGTTLLAAARTGRRSIGSEIDPEVYAAAVADLSQPTPTRLFD